MRSLRGLSAATAFLLIVPLAVLGSALFNIDAEITVHFVAAVGFLLLALSVFDFRTPRWLTWAACVAASISSATYLLQGVSNLMPGNASLHNLAFQLLGQQLERILPDVLIAWFVGLLLTDSQGKSKLLGVLVMAPVVGVELVSFAFPVYDAIPVLKATLLLPFVWLAFESAGRTSGRVARTALYASIWTALAIGFSGHAQAAPDAASFPPATEAALQRIVDKHLAASGAPGAVVGVWIPDRGTWVHAQGMADVEAGTSMREADTMRIGSITKTFLATVVLQLVDEGRLGLDDLLEEHLPGLRTPAGVTIRHLLGMRSGIFNLLEDPAFAGAYDSDPLMPFTAHEGVAIALRHPSDFPSGQRFGYSDTNYLLLGLVVERVTGQTAAEVIEQRIVQPLQLTSTSLPLTERMPEPFAHGYNSVAGGQLVDVSLANPDIPWTAGAMVSNLEDLRVWTRALATGELLSPSSQRERLQLTPIPGGEPVDAGYGLGILSLAGFIGHNGGIPGYSSIGMYLPSADATVVVLVNKSSLEGGAADMLFFDIVGLLFPRA